MGSDKAITRQEKRGQQELVKSDVLPTAGLLALRPMLEKAGGTVGRAVDGDGMFTTVTLPPGWEKRSSDHDMWSYLHDANGAKRASMFYKAAFYDRSARISGECRYSCKYECKTNSISVVDNTTGAVLFSVTAPEGKEVWDVEKQAYDWLNANFPDHNNPAAYWDGAE